MRIDADCGTSRFSAFWTRSVTPSAMSKVMVMVLPDWMNWPPRAMTAASRSLLSTVQPSPAVGRSVITISVITASGVLVAISASTKTSVGVSSGMKPLTWLFTSTWPLGTSR